MLDFEDPNIKIIRLTSGEDIIADCIATEDEEVVRLKEPMHIIFKRIASGKTIMLMMPWLPIELVEQNNTWLYSQDILAVMQPKQSLIGYYGKSVKDLQIEMLQANQEVEDSLNDYESNYSFDFSGGEEEYDDEPTEEEIEELNQLKMYVKKRLLH